MFSEAINPVGAIKPKINFKFTSTTGEKLPKQQSKEQFTWDSTSSEEEEEKEEVLTFFGQTNGF